jgi:hypothetical protein
LKAVFPAGWSDEFHRREYFTGFGAGKAIKICGGRECETIFERGSSGSDGLKRIFYLIYPFSSA